MQASGHPSRTRRRAGFDSRPVDRATLIHQFTRPIFTRGCAVDNPGSCLLGCERWIDGEQLRCKVCDGRRSHRGARKFNYFSARNITSEMETVGIDNHGLSIAGEGSWITRLVSSKGSRIYVLKTSFPGSMFC
jgi:hypothetical protein